jgi:hypothetical protein
MSTWYTQGKITHLDSALSMCHRNQLSLPHLTSFVEFTLQLILLHFVIDESPFLLSFYYL